MKLTLIGSTRYLDDFTAANAALTLRGHTIYSLAVFSTEHAKATDSAKVMLDLVHLNKIASSDAALLLGDGYFGHSTAREMLWCKVYGLDLIDGRGTKWNDPEQVDNIEREFYIQSPLDHDPSGLIEEALRRLNESA